MGAIPDFGRLAAAGVRGLDPYLPGKPPEELEREHGVSGAIKLASNENPLGPSPRAVDAVRRALKNVALYPDGGGFRLRQALARRHGVNAEQITLGNGSNDVLVLLAETFLTHETEAVYSQYAFIVYRLAVQATGAAARVAPAISAQGPQPLGHDLEAMRELMGPRTRLVFIANPNNPTGTWVERQALLDFLRSVPGDVIVVVDEAYGDYICGIDFPHALAWLPDFPNLVVTRTFSKIHGLAGLRVGYAVSHTDVAALLNRVRQPFNVNSLAQAGAIAALEDESHVSRSREMNARGQAQLEQGLDALGVRRIPSAGNFVLVDLGRAAAPVYERLLRAGIIVRPVANYGLPRHLRITVGLPEQNQRLLEALAAALVPAAGPAA